MSKMTGTADLTAADSSVPGVEASDINDGDIIERSSTEDNPNGLFRFIYKPVDGTEDITSDWVHPDNRKKVMRGWVEGVRSAIVGRAQAKIQEATAAAMEARARKIRDEQFEDPTPIPAATVGSRGGGSNSRGMETTSPVGVPSKPLVSSDPTTYVEDQLDVARERLAAAERAQTDIIREVLTARRDYEKWKTLAAALGSTSDDGVRQAGPSTDGLHSDSVLRQATRYDNSVIGRNLAWSQYDRGTGNPVPQGQPTNQGWAG